MNKVPVGLRSAALTAAGFFGMFGAKKYGEPEKFVNQHLEGSFDDNARRKGRHARINAAPRKYGIPKGWHGHAKASAELMYDLMSRTKSSHGQCTDWIRENRRRRACGIPQKRVLPFGLGIFDPRDRSIAPSGNPRPHPTQHEITRYENPETNHQPFYLTER